MKNTLLVFPGQGSQEVGMGLELAKAFKEAKDVFDEVDHALNQHLFRIMTDGDTQTLTQTENAQPAIMAASMAVVRVLEKQGGEPIYQYGMAAAGHSLGEYTALCAVQAFTLSDTAKLLKKRGQAMHAACPNGGAMAVILGLSWADLETVCKNAAMGDVCVAANDNADGQGVISGHLAAVERAMTLAKEQGAKRGLLLPVSSAFHSPLMEPAAQIMERALEHIQLLPPKLDVIHNVTAQPTAHFKDIKPHLITQICGQVLWQQSLKNAAHLGITTQIEIGHGKVLSGLGKRVMPEWTCLNLSTPHDIEQFLIKRQVV